jgi:signal transduction histidine kinase
MEETQGSIAHGRADTDASLDAERANLDNAEARIQVASHIAHEVVERDRLLADAPFKQFRSDADVLLALERAAGPPSSTVVRKERVSADEQKLIERTVTDAHLADERQRADAAIETERFSHERAQLRVVAFRKKTNEHLFCERSATDAAVLRLGETGSALAHYQDESARQRDVMGMVTHDLRSPLTVLAVNAQLIADDTNEPSTREAALESVRAAGRMARLLTDLLDIGRMDAGVFHVNPTSEPIASLLVEVERSYRPLLASCGLTLRVASDAGGAIARFDRDRILQVFSNLLGNTMKFAPAGGSVVLTARTVRGAIELAVRDSGAGIDAAALPHVFERFWQKDPHARRGLGLGLHICKTIIEAHGGQIRAESEIGKGATFRFTLPLGE